MTNNATYDNRNLNITTQNCLLLICISYCLLKEDKLHCGTMINAIPKSLYILGNFSNVQITVFH